MKEKIRRLVNKIKQMVKRQLIRKKSHAKPSASKPEAPKIQLPPKEEKLTPPEYFTGPLPVQYKKEIPKELPSGYGENKIVLQTRDPWWVHAYWEISTTTLQCLSAQLAQEWQSAKKVLRVYDISHIIFDGTNAYRTFDIEVDEENNWYIDVGQPGRSWCVDLGFLLSDKRFVRVCRSNTVFTPLDGPSWITDEEWLLPQELFARLYGMGVGFGMSSPIGKGWQQRIKREFASGAFASRSIITKKPDK